MTHLRRFLLGLLPISTVFGNSLACADVMPWSGASASVSVLEPASGYQPNTVTQTQTGATAAASATKDAPVNYVGRVHQGGTQTYTAIVHGSADAQATGRAGDLLHAGATYGSPNPGTDPGITQGAGPVQATASWTGDRVSIQGPALPARSAAFRSVPMARSWR
jgi:hypothetical protein